MGEANQITCPHCGQPYAVRPEQWALYLGRTINCTKCGQPFVVSAPQQGGPPAGAPLVSPPAYPPGQAQFPSQYQAPPPYPAQGGGYPPAPGGYVPQYAAGGYGYPQPAPPTSGWAIAGLVCGILGCVSLGIAGLLGIIFSIVGLVKTRDNRAGGRGIAIAGLTIGILSLFTALPAAVMLPALSRAREMADRVKCASNMRQLGQAMLMYANANQNQLPDSLKSLAQFDSTLSPAVFVCPSDSKKPASPQSLAADLAAGRNVSYVYVGKGLSSSAPPDVVLLYEPLQDHRREGMNVLFADGHVEFLQRSQAMTILTERAAGTFPITYPATPGTTSGAQAHAPPTTDSDSDSEK